MTFDHRSSILRFLDEQADKYEADGQKEYATVLRANASSVQAKLDIRPGKNGIADPIPTIVQHLCAQFNNATVLREVLAPEKGNAGAIRVRFAAMWVAKKRLGWGDERLAFDFNRDRSTVSNGITRANEIRATDDEFKRITDEAVAEPFLCHNCQYPMYFSQQ